MNFEVDIVFLNGSHVSQVLPDVTGEFFEHLMARPEILGVTVHKHA